MLNLRDIVKKQIETASTIEVAAAPDIAVKIAKALQKKLAPKIDGVKVIPLSQTRQMINVKSVGGKRTESKGKMIYFVSIRLPNKDGRPLLLKRYSKLLDVPGWGVVSKDIPSKSNIFKFGYAK